MKKDMTKALFKYDSYSSSSSSWRLTNRRVEIFDFVFTDVFLDNIEILLSEKFPYSDFIRNVFSKGINSDYLYRMPEERKGIPRPVVRKIKRGVL